jgi:hypothetical protein
MRKIILASVIMAVMLLTWSSLAPARAQDSAKDDKPTFYHLVPGTYVNGWPRFIVHYPKDWVERPLYAAGGDVFRVSPPGPVQYPAFSGVVVPFPPSLDKFAEAVVPVFKAAGCQDVTVISNKPSQLRDGTRAQEVEVGFVRNGAPGNWLGLGTKKGDVLIQVNVIGYGGKIGEDLRALIYSLEFQVGKDEPVKVPPDVQEFLDKHGNDIVSHDLAKVMSHYSDRFLNSGVKKGEVERMWRWGIGSWMSQNGTITDFVPVGDRAYLAGFVKTNLGTFPISETSIIKENGEWKWYGNQREVVP